ncbi:MAG: hypothetical protein H7343_14400 [Undibacterium sp.]|nr:hypothetical protein [Opitutaceae bacterium]
MPVILAPVRGIAGIAAEHTSLGASLAAVAAKNNFTPAPTPRPNRSSSFAATSIPSSAPASPPSS